MIKISKDSHQVLHMLLFSVEQYSKWAPYLKEFCQHHLGQPKGMPVVLLTDELILDDAVYDVFLSWLNTKGIHAKDNDVVTRFVAGGHGACVYDCEITRTVLERCWEHDEFRCLCPKCNSTAYIHRFGGSITTGGFLELDTYCPICKKVHHRSKVTADVHWSELKQIADKVIEEQR